MEYTDGTVRVKREHDEGYEIFEAKTPVVITVTKTDYEPRFPSIKGKMAANRAVIEKLSTADLEIDQTMIGLKGSPTKVKRTFTPTKKTGGIVIEEATGADSAKKLVALLTEAKLV